MRKIVRVPGSSPYGFRLVGGDGAVVTVARVRKESKAEAAGLQEGDAVLVINDVSCHGLSYNSVFGLTELNDHELKLEILRGVDAQSNWRTALACLDGSVQKLNEEEVFALLKNKNKQEFGSFQSLNQHVFQLQDAKPKFKQFSLPIIDVVLDSSDTQANFVTKPEIRGNQTTIHVVRESRQPLFHQEHERSFISRTSQDFQEKQNITPDVIHAQTDQPIKFEFQADSYKPLNFGTTSKQFSENVERKFFDVTPSLQSYQFSCVHDSSPNIKASFEPPQRYASTSQITITSKNTNPLTDEPRWLPQGGNVHKSCEAPPTQTNIEEDVYSSSHFDKFPRNETSYFDDTPVNSWKNFDEQRKVFKVKKFNVSGSNNPPRRDEDSLMANPLLQTTRNFNAWSSENNFQEPFSLSSDFYQSPQEQSFQVFPGSSQQSPHQLQPSPYQPYPPPSYQPHPPPSYQPQPPPPPPLPEAGIPNQQISGSPNELNLIKYGGNQGLRDNEKQALKEKIQKAKDMAHSVLSPANKNSKGQRMFLKRRANSEHWVIEGPDPVAKQMVEQTTQNQNRAPFKPFPSFNTNQSFNPTNQSFNPMSQSFNPERQFYQSESLSYSTPVQKWSPFGSTPQVTLGYCDL